MDLFGLLDLHENKKNVYVIDTHRPYHPANVKNMQNVCNGKTIPLHCRFSCWMTVREKPTFLA